MGSNLIVVIAFWILDSGFRIQDSGFRIQENVDDR